jgi:hypothetical protein
LGSLAAAVAIGALGSGCDAPWTSGKSEPSTALGGGDQGGVLGLTQIFTGRSVGQTTARTNDVAPCDYVPPGVAPVHSGTVGNPPSTIPPPGAPPATTTVPPHSVIRRGGVRPVHPTPTPPPPPPTTPPRRAPVRAPGGPRMIVPSPVLGR